MAGLVRIVPMTDRYATEVLAIYQAGLDTGNASFEVQAPSWSRWDAGHLRAHRFVALADPGRADLGDARPDQVLGWVAVSPVSARAVYAGVVELSVYVHQDARGRGVGAALLAELVSSTEAAGVWTVQTGIFPENTASIALHQRAGFRVVGTRERVGRHHGRWRDVVFLERRSAVV